MSGSQQKTWDVLAKTRNRAALRLLAAGLRSASPDIRTNAIRCCIRRPDAESHRLLLRSFKRFDAADRAVLAQAHAAMPHHLAGTLKAALLSGSAKRCADACHIVAECRDFDLFPALVQALERRDHRHPAALCAAMMELAAALHGELAAAAAPHGSAHRDPVFVRRHVLGALESSLQTWVRHERSEILEAFLLIAPHHNATLLKVLQDRNHPCHERAIALLSSSTAPAILERLVELCRDTDAPTALLEAAARRVDRPFIDLFLRELKTPVPLRLLHNMKRLRHVAFLESNRDMLLEFDGRTQAAAVELAVASGIAEDAKFELLTFWLQHGLAEARRASCFALTKFSCPEAAQLVLAALDDPDGCVQAAAVRQLRERGVPDALQTLVSLLDSRSIEVRDAAHSSLAEFNFVRYRAMFDLLDEEAARTTGTLVHKVDFSAREGLLAELTSPSVSARLRGIEMALAMEATRDVAEQLLALASGENVAVREAALAALRHDRMPEPMPALESATRTAERP